LVSAALQNLLARFRLGFLKLPAAVQARIESAIGRLGAALDTHPHQRMKGIEAFRVRVGDYRVIYDFDRTKGVLHLLSVGHRREIYRKQD